MKKGANVSFTDIRSLDFNISAQFFDFDVADLANADEIFSNSIIKKLYLKY